MERTSAELDRDSRFYAAEYQKAALPAYRRKLCNGGAVGEPLLCPSCEAGGCAYYREYLRRLAEEGKTDVEIVSLIKKFYSDRNAKNYRRSKRKRKEAKA